MKALETQLLSLAKAFGSQQWAFVADPTKMDPIFSKETSDAFAALHKTLEDAGCVAIAFLDGKTAAMKLQSQKHQDRSGTQKLVVTHIRDDAEALAWLEQQFGI